MTLLLQELDDGAVVFAKKGVILCAGQGSLAVAATVAAATTGEQKENEPHSFHHIVVEAPSEAAPGFYAGFQQPEYSGHVTVGDGKVRGFLSFTFHRDAEAESRVTKIVRMLASGGGGATTPTTTDSRHYGCGGLTSSFDEGGVHREIQHLFAADWSTVRELPSLQVPFHKQTIERATKFVYGMAALSSDV